MTINILDYTTKELELWFSEQGENTYRARQVMQWVHQEGILDISLMTNLSKSLRHKLSENVNFLLPEITNTEVSADGTIKWLLKLDSKNSIETVYIPEASRGTLCVSSQVGCALNCSFCSTGKQGFNRNLTTAEIIGQVWLAVRQLSKLSGKHDRRVTNIVMMGMGEPLLNFDSVIAAMDIMMDDYAYGFSNKRVTLSTSGLIPEMKKLSQKSLASLAVSLHAPNDALRDILVPINKKYPIKKLMDVCANYFPAESKRKVTFEYVMLKDVNDSLEIAKELARIVSNVPCKINLIPFNPFPGAPYLCSAPKKISAFRDYLVQKGLNTMVRKTRGEDIAAACGQLAGEVLDKTKRASQWQKIMFDRNIDKASV